MDKVITAATGLTVITVGTVNEERINFLDIDVLAGAWSYNLPISNLVVLGGFLLTVYAARQAYIQKKERQRRKGEMYEANKRRENR